MYCIDMIAAAIKQICSSDRSCVSSLTEYRKAICREANKCKIAEKSEIQLKYILSPITNNIFLKACPGSGKTEVVGLKAAYEFNQWKQKNHGIAVLTFTNNAADVIEKRVRQFVGLDKSTYPHFIGTFDSWLHRYVAHPSSCQVTGYIGRMVDNKHDKSIRLVDDGTSDGWINNYKCNTGYCYLSKEGNSTLKFIPLYANMLQYDIERSGWEIRNPASESNEYITDQEYFDSVAFRHFRSDKPWLTLQRLQRNFEDIKTTFMRDGFATYHDIERISYRFLKGKQDAASRLSHRFPFIIVDECQDLSWSQLEILRLLYQSGTILHFVGDLNQAIWEFRKVDPRKVQAFVSANNFECQELTDNFRSCQPIVSLCQKLIGGGPVCGKEPTPKEPACIYFVYEDKESISSLPARFEKYLRENLAVDVAKSAILVRGKSMAYRLKALNRSEIKKSQVQLAMAIHLWNTQRATLKDDALEHLGQFVSAKYFKGHRSDARSHYRPEGINSPMRWRLFLARILDRCVQDERMIGNLNQTWSAWTQFVRDRLSDTATLCLPVLSGATDRDLKAFEKLDGFNALRGKKDELVSDTLATQKENPTNLQIATIHSAKGKEFHAVMLVSSPDRRGVGRPLGRMVGGCSERTRTVCLRGEFKTEVLPGLGHTGMGEGQKRRLEPPSGTGIYFEGPA